VENPIKYLSAPLFAVGCNGIPTPSRLSKKQSRAKSRFQLFLGLIALAIIYLPHSASATGNGIAGYSGKSVSTCTKCHSTGANPTVTLSGPTSVTSGSTNTYTLTVGGSGNSGMDVASGAGTFTAGTGSKVLNGEVVHSSPSSSHSWTFTWTAPTVTGNTSAILYGAAINSFNGGTGTATLTATVMATAPPPPAHPNLTASPSSLAFSSTMGGASPTAKTISVGSSGSAISYTVASSGSWLSATGSGNTPGSVSVSVNPASLAAGTYNGSVSISSSGAANSPLTVPVTLTVAAAPPPTTANLTATPASLAFSYTAGGASPAGKTISVGSSGGALTYTVASTGTWLSASGGGSTPGNVNLSVNPANMAAGTYNGSVTLSASGASNSPLMVPVTLTVTSTTPPPPPPTTGGTLSVSPTRLVFYAEGTDTPSPQNLSVTGSSAAMSFTAEAFGGSWISVTPSASTTPGKVSVSAYSTGLPAGTYSCVVQIKSGSSARNLEVVLVVGRSGWGGERNDSVVRPFSFEPSGSDTTSASWRRGAGAMRTSTDPANQGLVLVKNRLGSRTAIAGVVVTGAAGSPLSQLSFDLRTDSECSAQAPQFVVITNDNVVHSAGCASGRARALTATGWKRVSFNPGDGSQITPAVKPGTTVKTIALVMDKIAGNGYAVLDNINLNGTFIGKQ